MAVPKKDLPADLKAADRANRKAIKEGIKRGNDILAAAGATKDSIIAASKRRKD